MLASNGSADALIQKMSLDEKISLLGGAGDGFSVPGLEKYGIPPMVMTDGAVGVVRIHPGTAFPASIALAASFDPALAYEMSKAIGEEARFNGENVLLAPNVNIARTPLGGRVFESYGEDPYLAGQIAASYVRGAQASGVMTTVKHFALNNQEFERMETDVQIDEKTFQEIYLPAFKAAIDAGGVAVMAAYNKIRGAYASENSYLLNDVLKKQMNFSGFVVSDWGATHSTVTSALAGLDVEMPNLSYFGEPLKNAVLDGTLSVDVVNDKVRRILWAMDKMNYLGATQSNVASVDMLAHAKIAKAVAAQSLVLLKNEKNILPLDPNKKMRIAVIGPSANIARTGGGGSSYVPSPGAISPLAALKAKLPHILYTQGTGLAADPVQTNPNLFRTLNKGRYVTGFQGDYFNNMDLSGDPALTRFDSNLNFNWDWSGAAPGISSSTFSVRWTGEFIPQQNGTHEFSFSFDDGMRLYIDNKLVLDAWENETIQGGLRTRKYKSSFVAGHSYNLRIEYVQRGNLATFTAGVREPINGVFVDALQEAQSLAKNSDVAILFVGLSNKLESESFDRTDFSLPTDQVELIQTVTKANPNTIVVVEAGTPIDLSWQDTATAVIYAWYPGVEGANAISDVLLGRSNPSGKLPITLPKTLADVPAMQNYPGDKLIETYSEGLHVGYRGITNYFYPFGYGLSYSRFSVENLKVQQNTKSVFVSVNLKNTSNIDGTEVVEVYTQHPETQDYINLKAFKKVVLAKNSSQVVTFELPLWQTFQEYDSQASAWSFMPGSYKIQVRAGSVLLPIETNIELK